MLHLDPMRSDVDLAELPCPQRLVLFEKFVHITAKRVGDTVPVDFRLRIRIFRRVRRGLSLVDPVLAFVARLDLSSRAR